MSEWLFDHEPTAKEVNDMLSTLPAWNGSETMMSDYINYVLPYERKQKGKALWTLYMQVAGRIHILRDAHRQSDGTIQQVSEKLNLDWRTEMLIVHGFMESQIYGTIFEAATAILGEKAGFVDKTNPVENAITSWRGRAIAALCGGGIIPGSGVASYEEATGAEKRQDLVDKGVTIIPSASATESKPAEKSKSSTDSAKQSIVKAIKNKCEVKKVDFDETVKAILAEQGNAIADGEDVEQALLQLEMAAITTIFNAIR